MDLSLYEMIYKRKSFHLFRNIGDEKLTSEELKNIEDCFASLRPLDSDIKVKIKITNDTTCHRGQEYCILFYSEMKENYLQNIGYLGEQLDLYLVKHNIASLWFGIGKVEEETLDGLNFVIMIAIKKANNDTCFRKDMFKSKRKALSDVWDGTNYEEIGNIVRFAPSACNSQPWKVRTTNSSIEVYRYRKTGFRGIMPIKAVKYYNQIDIGIFLCFLELCLGKENIKYQRTVFIEKDHDAELNLTAKYEIEG